MKVWEYIHPHWGIAFKRISHALHVYAPENIQWTQDKDAADVHLIHVVGEGEIPLLTSNKPKIIIQHCYFTAGAPAVNYAQYWKDSLLTTSFHNLPNYTDINFPFHHMPWGADPEVFNLLPYVPRKYKIVATGHVAESECIDKVFEACVKTNNILLQTGQNFGWNNNHYRHTPYLRNGDFTLLLNSCEYVSALRVIEGFELMGIEGLFCGARPIVPDDPTYDWYRQYGHTIDTKRDIVEQLVEILKTPATPLTPEEYTEVTERFSWKNIIRNFYARFA